MNRIAGRAGIALILVLVLLTGFALFIFEYAFRAGEWVVFPGSPHVYNAENIGCGVIVDRDGALLLDLSGQRTYAQNDALRMSTMHWLGDREGNISAPALSAYASELAGYDILNGLYAYDGAGGTAELTLSARLQTVALEAMGEYKGTVGVYNYKTGQLLCAVTTPTYDPDHIPVINTDDPQQYDGVYVNRFVQSLYTPGSIFKIVTLAAAIETIPDITEQKFVCRGSCVIDSQKIICDGTHWEQDLKMAFRNSCNCAFAEIAKQLGPETLTRYAEQFGVLDALEFDGIITPEGQFDLSNANMADTAWAGVGQYTDLVNPCSFMTFVGAIANGGKGVKPHLVEKVTSEGITTYSAKTQSGERIMSASTAEILREYMAFNVEDKYGSENFPGLTVCAKTGTAEVGGDKKPNAMIAGFVQDEQCPLAFVVAVEDAGYGKTVCVPILAKILVEAKGILAGEN